MNLYRDKIEVDLEAEFDAADLSGPTRRIISESGIQNGQLNLFNRGSTATVTAIEYEPGCLADLEEALQQLAPVDKHYKHHERWGDGNGFSHLRSALLDPSISVPIIEGEPAFSQWQQPIVINFDNRARTREIWVTVMGK